MPFPLPTRSRSGPRRRSLLAGLAGTALLTGCTSGDGDAVSATRAGQASAAERTRARAARDSAALGARYDEVIAAHPSLARRLGPLRAEVASHAKAFGSGGPGGSPSPSSSSPSSSGAPSGAASAVPVPAAPEDALASLAARERELADTRTVQSVDVPGELARLLASVAASGAAHAYLLTEGGK
ncbi:hypothetical protein GT204_00775 [Streptomyces sp. SID4919]|nr:hypothetical protein [Streptomyces sp. AmelKG-E11A]MYY07461.1 hypothetical protein [Streptomyces sp. SID4919]SCK62184.1 hypothetical protein YW7DRAFT_06529 [Streptomyces sp. AmelKG-E11A]